MAPGGGGNKPKPPTRSGQRRPSGRAAKRPRNVAESIGQEIVRGHQQRQNVLVPRNGKQGGRGFRGPRAKRTSRLVRALQRIQGIAKGLHPWVALLASALTIWHSYWPDGGGKTETTQWNVPVCSHERLGRPAASSRPSAPCDLDHTKIEFVLPVRVEKVALPRHPSRVTQRRRRD